MMIPNRHRKAILTGLTSLLAFPAIATAQPTDRAGWQADYRQLKAALEASYANLAWKGSLAGGVDLPALDRAASAALAAARTEEDADRALREFVAGFRDGHFSELPYLAPAEGPGVPEPTDPPLDPADPATGCAALGYASTASVAFTLPFESLPGFRLIGDGLSQSFRTGLLASNGRVIGILRIQNFRVRPFPATCIEAWAALRRSGAAITPASIRQAAWQRWFADMAAALAELRSRGATVMLVDVGNNGGGDDSGDWTARLFSARPVRSARLLMIDAPPATDYFDEQLGDLRAVLAASPKPADAGLLQAARDLFARQKTAVGQAHCDLSWVWRERRDWPATGCRNLLDAAYAGGASPGVTPDSPADDTAAIALSSAARVRAYAGSWTGPTYVLTDRRTYSSAEMFAAVMQDNGIARLIGGRTGGDGCGFMVDTTPILLTHTRLRFRIPNCMRLRADGTNEEAGITPDLPVAPTEGESDRARAARVIATIAEDVAPRR